MNLNSYKSGIMPKFNYRDLIIFIVPVLIFGLYLFVYKPGVLTVASYSQLHQIAGGRFITTNPIFHTFLVMISLKLTNGVTFLGAFQILVFSLMWMVICKYHRDDLSQNTNEFILQFILTLIICLIPINAVYSVTLSSNVLFSYSIMFLCFLIKVMIDRDGEISLGFCIILAVTFAVMSGLNNYGILIALVSFIVIAYYLLRKNIPQERLITLVGITVVCVMLVASLNVIYDVKGVGYDDYTSKVNFPVNDAFDDGVDLEAARNEFFSKTNYEPIESYENLDSSNGGNYKFDMVDSYADLFRNSFLGGLFDNPILYMILSIALLALINVLLPSKETYLLYVPPFANVIISIFTGQNNLYSNLLVFYLILVIFMSLWFSLSLNPRNITDIASTIAQQGTIENRTPLPKRNIETQPRLETEQDYVDDEYYSNLESEIEELTLEDINEMLGQAPTEQAPEAEQTSDGDSDLIDEILKEIEMGKK